MTLSYPLYSLTGHSNAVRALVVINEEYLASASLDQTIRLWSLRSYSNVKTWTASTSHIYSLAFDPILNVLASGDAAMLVNVWDSGLWTSISTLGNKNENEKLKVFLNKNWSNA
jgi:WD40 repeat protein